MAKYRIKGTAHQRDSLRTHKEGGFIPWDAFSTGWYYTDRYDEIEALVRDKNHLNGKITIDVYGDYYDVFIEDLVPYYGSTYPTWIDDMFSLNWSTERIRTHNYSQRFLLDSIRVRYAMLERPESGLSNVVMDSYFPKILYSTNLNIEIIKEIGGKLPKTATAISPFVADLLGVRQMSAEQMCRFLGYPPRTLKKLLVSVQKKDLTPIFLGYGGTGMNTVHWLTEMLDMCHINGLFRSLIIYEPENAEFSNLLRFPKNSLNIRSQSARKLDMLSPKEERLIARYGVEKKHFYLSRAIRNENVFTSKAIRIAWKRKPESFFYYGAPDIQTRARIQENGAIPLVTATHADLKCDIFLNPIMDTDLQVESYGMIQPAPFFMNQLRMAIALLELLASDEDLRQVDKHVFSYQFDGVKQGTTDRIYNFQIAQNTLVQTDAAAQGEF